MPSCIRLKNIRVNNLDIRELNLELGKFHVFAGPSGSGKSSLAFDVLYAAADAKGQARGVSRIYRKSGNSYEISGLPSSVIGIEQQLTSHGAPESVAWHVGLVAWPYQSAESSPCPRCGGRGYIRDIDPDRVVRDPKKHVTAGALTPAVKKSVGIDSAHWKRYCDLHRIRPQTPWANLPKSAHDDILWKGSSFFDPVIPTLRGMLNKPPAGEMTQEMAFYTASPKCPECHGWGVTGPLPLDEAEFTLGDVKDRGGWFSQWVRLLGLQGVPLRAPLFCQSSAMVRKLRFLAALQDLPPQSLVIFDEPAAGMTHEEATKMAEVLREVQKEGHTVIAVEHMQDVVCAADIVTQFGPGSGAEGGKILSSAPFCYKTVARRPMPKRVDAALKENGRNLQAHFGSWFGFTDFRIEIPLLRFSCVCGPSGSGKTAYLEASYAACDKTPVAWQGRVGLKERNGNEGVRRPHKVTPDPIGLHAGSTPATYTKLWDKMRELFAALPESKKKRLNKAHFSFNTKEGQCPRCKGRGFLSDDSVHYLECSQCQGTRFLDKILDLKYKNASIADVNMMTMRNAARLLDQEKAIYGHIVHFMDVALEYLVMGQPSNTLSGGENLRVKIVDLLSCRLGDRSLYIMDNPCRGVGSEATAKLIKTFHKLAKSHTVLIAENDPAVVGHADWLIILGTPIIQPDGSRMLHTRYVGPPWLCPSSLWAELSPEVR